MASWCPKCGYYPAVDNEDAVNDMSWQEHVVEESEEEVPENIWQSIPAWFWMMMVGVAGIIGFSLAIRMMMPGEDSPRGTIALAQLGIGFLSFAIAHGIAGRHAMKTDPRVNMTDVLLSWFNVWQTSISQLPHTCKRAWSIVWGLTMMLTAVTVIGGIDYSAPFRTDVTKKKTTFAQEAIKNVAAAAKAQGDDDATMEEALQELDDPDAMVAGAGGAASADGVGQLAGSTDEATQMALDKLDDMLGRNKEQKLICFVYGVVTDARRNPKSLLFAGNTSGANQHVAELMASDMPREAFIRIVQRLYKVVQPDPVIATDRSAVWVAPDVSCRLKHEGITEDGILINPTFEAIVVVQPGRRREYSASDAEPTQPTP
jgi:hypothetical protein